MGYILLLSIPLYLGIAMTIQSGLNDTIQRDSGLTLTLLLNNIVVFIIAIFLLFSAYQGIFSHGSLLNLPAKYQIKPWHFIPGLLGATIVLGFAISFDRLGASKTVIFVVLAQLVSSAIWDWGVKNINLSSYRLIGIAVVGVGCLLYFKDYE